MIQIHHAVTTSPQFFRAARIGTAPASTDIVSNHEVHVKRRNEEATRVDAPRPSVPRPGASQPPPLPRKSAPRFEASDDEEATTLFARDKHAPASSPRAVDRPRSVFPEPPRDRPRVFERPQRADVTTLRPSCVEERTELRPQAHVAASPSRPVHAPVPPRHELHADGSRAQYAPPAPPPRSQAPDETMPPVVTRPSLVPAVITVAPPSPSDATPAFRRLGRLQVGALAFAAVLAPFVAIFALVGASEPAHAHAAASMSPAVVEASVFMAHATPAPAAAPTAVADARPAAAPTTAALPPPPRPTAPPTAFAAAPPSPQPAAPRPVAAAPRPVVAYAAPPPAPRPAAKPKSGPTELPDAQAADALARAQLEAALR